MTAATKKKTRVYRTGAKRTGRSVDTGKFIDAKSLRMQYRMRRLRKSEPLQVQPIEETPDPRQFAKDLLVSDKVIMDYLAR